MLVLLLVSSLPLQKAGVGERSRRKCGGVEWWARVSLQVGGNWHVVHVTWQDQCGPHSLWHRGHVRNLGISQIRMHLSSVRTYSFPLRRKILSLFFCPSRRASQKHVGFFFSTVVFQCTITSSLQLSMISPGIEFQTSVHIPPVFTKKKKKKPSGFPQFPSSLFVTIPPPPFRIQEQCNRNWEPAGC